MLMLTVVVPSGIGDVSWMYSKLKHAEVMHWEIADGWPYRTKPFLDLLEGIAGVSYGKSKYCDIAVFTQMHVKGTWAETVSNGLSRLLVEANTHLERGLRLEDWMPDLPCDFHYNIYTSDADEEKACQLLSGFQPPLWGISAASYRGSEAWSTWGVDQWIEFLKAFEEKHGGTIILLGGFWDDLTHTIASHGYADLVGKTSVGTAIEVLKRLEGYIGFSSGLGVLMTVLKRPALMMWPAHQHALSTSWAPQWMIDEGLYVAMPWVQPKDVLMRASAWVGDLNVKRQSGEDANYVEDMWSGAGG
jgi:hypothetical protein